MDIIGERSETINNIIKRDLERQINIQKRKDGKELLSADNEKLDFFEQTFNDKFETIRNAINRSILVEKTQLPDHFNRISKDIMTLQKYVTASSIFLRNYDLKRCQKSLQDLTVEAKLLEDKLLPKKKFGFKNKSVKTGEGTSKSKNLDVVDAPHKNNKFALLENSCGFSNVSNDRQLNLKASEVLRKDVFLENLENCTVKLFGNPSTLHLNNLKNCIVLSGPVSTSIFAENCENCTFAIACQQLRLHSSKNVNIYLYVSSRAIMEDCKQIHVAPYTWSYEAIENDFQSAALDSSLNNWMCIDDFNWLHLEKASPNWDVIPEMERIKCWTSFLNL